MKKSSRFFARLLLTACLQLVSIGPTYAFNSIYEVINQNSANLDLAQVQLLNRVYSALDYKPQFIQLEDRQLVQKIAEIQNYLPTHGIGPSHYRLSELIRLNNDFTKEVLIANELINIAKAIHFGRVNPREVSGNIKIKGSSELSEAGVANLAVFFSTLDKAHLEKFSPPYELYFNLRKKLLSQNLNQAEFEKVILSLEKLRWLPKNAPSRFLLVNTSSATAYLFDTRLPINSPLKYQRVVVGTAARPTPTMLDEVSRVILNPTWTISMNGQIWRDDKLPALKEIYLKAESVRSGSGISAVQEYLDKNSFEILMNGETGLNAKDIPWSVLTPEHRVNFQLRQKSGDMNALGVVKFDLALNTDAIYLHDTNGRWRFDQSNRHLSSGCIRVQRPLELASYLLTGKRKWDLEKIKSVTSGPESRRKNKILKLGDEGKKLTVFTLHLTAEVVNNELIFSSDVYLEDEALKRKLELQGFSINNMQ
jgi:hypothetical protein